MPTYLAMRQGSPLSNRWRLSSARDSVNGLRRRLHREGFECDLTEVLDPFGIAEAYLDCQICPLGNLSDRRALEYLAGKWGLDVSQEEPEDVALAGALYVTATGRHRWIFIETTDHRRRQRWTVAHELGHLMTEALPHLEKKGALVGELLASDRDEPLLKFGRCSLAQGKGLTQAAKLELNANDFAAELLMPWDGIRRLVAEEHPHGFRSQAELENFIRALQHRYDVSRDAAERRVAKDLGIQPYASGPNSDLFA
jgi:hypothetical protein